MKRLFVRAKIHRATVTDANLNYKGSISIGSDLLLATGMSKFEFVHVNNVRNGAHWETYIIEGAPGTITLNGPPAHHFSPGDKVVIWCLTELQSNELEEFTHTVAYVDENNVVTSVEVHRIFE